MRTLILIISLAFCLKACLHGSFTRGVLVFDNQSDYCIDITFYRSNRNVTALVNNTNNSSDTVIRIEPNTEWVKSYSKRGGGGYQRY